MSEEEVNRRLGLKAKLLSLTIFYGLMLLAVLLPVILVMNISVILLAGAFLGAGYLYLSFRLYFALVEVMVNTKQPVGIFVVALFLKFPVLFGTLYVFYLISETLLLGFVLGLLTNLPLCLHFALWNSQGAHREPDTK